MRKFFQRTQAPWSKPEQTAEIRRAPTHDVRPVQVGSDAGSAESRTPEFADTEVSELSELEAHALCAREGIPVFWRRDGRGRPD
jgi:hypothetical protein